MKHCDLRVTALPEVAAPVARELWLWSAALLRVCYALRAANSGENHERGCASLVVDKCLARLPVVAAVAGGLIQPEAKRNPSHKSLNS